MKISVIFNVGSKRVKKAKLIKRIDSFFANKSVSIDYHAFKQKTKLDSIKGYDSVIVCGGDGTISDVCHNIAINELSPKVLVLPLGTNNDYARILNLKKKKTEELLNLILENKSSKMSLSLLNDRYFLYASAFGKMSEVSYETSRKLVRIFGYFGYLMKCFISLFSFNKLIIKIDGKEERFVTCFVLKTNIVAGIKLKRIDPEDKLILVGLKYRNIFSNFRIISFFLLKGRLKEKDFCIKFDQLKLSSNISKINLDGELYKGNQLEYKATDKKISFYQ